ncbi:6phosphogluconate dehydrogenase NAD-binding domain containing protein [Diplonema papillatum]|nr:6phosphogluconate dehydrogenase NAD-binding domain containing protein [Diplonema papillatum]
MCLVKIGWIGTGIMGSHMAAHILRSGKYDMKVYTRTRRKAADLEKMGAKWAACAQEAGEGRDIVVSMVGGPRDVEEVLLGEKTGALHTMNKNGLLIDMSTSTPSLAEEINCRAQTFGVHSVDAPVSGGDIGAKNASLTIFCGGKASAVNAAKPLFDIVGKSVVHAGPSGSGQHMKAVNQILVCTNILGVCESLLYAKRAGLDLSDTINAIGKGAAGGFQINNLGPRVARRDFEPGFAILHFVKDLGIAISEAKRMNLTLPGLTLAENLFKSLQDDGYGQKGTQGLMIALEKLNRT